MTYRATIALLAATAVSSPLASQEIVGQPGPHRLGGLYITGKIEPEATVFRFVEQVGFASRWPLAAAYAYVGCARLLPRATVVIVVNGTAWALNPETKTWLKSNKAELEIDGHKGSVNAGDQREPWLSDDPEFPGTQLSTAPLLDIAKRLGCLPKHTGAH